MALASAHANLTLTAHWRTARGRTRRPLPGVVALAGAHAKQALIASEAREHLGLPSSDSSLVVAPAYRAGRAPLRGGSCERSRREGFLRPLRTRRCVGSTSSVRCRRGGSFERSREADLDPLRRRSAEQSRLGCLPRDSGESNALLPLATSRADRLKGCESPS